MGSAPAVVGKAFRGLLCRAKSKTTQEREGAAHEGATINGSRMCPDSMVASSSCLVARTVLMPSTSTEPARGNGCSWHAQASSDIVGPTVPQTPVYSSRWKTCG